MNLAENIKNYRKRFGFTQEQLADRLGITVASVSKWETGVTQPDLQRLVYLAEIFHTSIDRLVGYEASSVSLREELANIKKHFHLSAFEEALSACQRLQVRYPNHFEVLYHSGRAFFFQALQGVEKNKNLQTALSLFQKARTLIDDNEDETIDIIQLDANISNCYSELGQPEKAISILKRSNFDGHNDLAIAAAYSYGGHGEQLIKAKSYLDKAKAPTIIYPFWYCIILCNLAYKKAAVSIEEALKTIEVNQAIIQILQVSGKTSFLTRVQVILSYYESLFRFEKGDKEGTEAALRKVFSLAKQFEEAPDYTLENLQGFAGSSEKAIAHDNFGPDLLEGIRSHLFQEEENGSTSKKILQDLFLKIEEAFNEQRTS